MGENKVLYRNPTGTGQHTLVEVIAFEMGELCNVDIPAYCLEHYGNVMDEVSRGVISEAVTQIESGNMDVETAFSVAHIIVNVMESVWGIKICSVVWLAGYDAVAELYCDFGGTSDIMAVPASDYILSDLGYDGILFAYPIGMVFA